jgi:hypothetical protein
MFNVALDDVRVLEHATIKVDMIIYVLNSQSRELFVISRRTYSRIFNTIMNRQMKETIIYTL